MMEAHKQFCTFMVDDLYFGIDVLKVQEIIRYQEMTKVPLSAQVISGLINLRGQVVTAMDLRLRLGLERRAEGVLPMNVIVRTGDDTMSFLVDEIGDVMEPDEESFEPPPVTIHGPVRQLIDGIYKLDDRLLLVMNAERTMDLPAGA
jgi:purine-binding chemotaxis protein CheW